MSPSPSDSLTFEKALADLEAILRSLEDGNTTLEQSLSQYERGVALLRNCYAQLRDAEQRILKLSGVDGDGRPVLEAFDHSASVETVAERKKPAARRPKVDDGSA